MRATLARLPGRSPLMPTLFRFLVITCALAGMVYASLFMLANFFEPQPTEIVKPLLGVKVRQ